MRSLLLILLIAISVAGCDLLTGSSPEVTAPELVGTDWRVETTSDDALMPPETRFSFFGKTGFARFGPDGTTCGRWRLQNELLVVRGERKNPLLIARVDDVGPDQLELTVQPHEYHSAARVVMRGGPLPQDQFESEARTDPDYSIRKDSLGRYVTDTGEDWEMWRHSPLLTCGQHTITPPAPNPVHSSAVTLHVRRDQQRDPRSHRFNMDQLMVRGYDHRGELITLTDTFDEQRLSFDPSRLEPPQNSFTGPQLYRIFVTDGVGRVAAYGNLVVDR